MNPQRVFIDIVDGNVSKVPVKHLVRNGVINDISLIQYDSRNRRVARVVISFDDAASYDLETVGKTLRIMVDGFAPNARTQTQPGSSRGYRIEDISVNGSS